MSSGKKDQRRPDLIVPYKVIESKNPPNDVTSTVASTLPMAAMFLRNRMIGWAALTFSVQSWLGETEASKAAGKQPAFFGIIFALVALVVTYLPQAGQRLNQGTSTGAPPAAPAPAP